MCRFVPELMGTCAGYYGFAGDRTADLKVSCGMAPSH